MAELTAKGREYINEISQFVNQLSFALDRPGPEILKELTGTESFPKGIGDVSKMKTWAEFRIKQVRDAAEKKVGTLSAPPAPTEQMKGGFLNNQGAFEEAPLEEPPEDYIPGGARESLLPPSASQVSEMATMGLLTSIDQTLKLILAELMKQNAGRG